MKAKFVSLFEAVKSLYIPDEKIKDQVVTVTPHQVLTENIAETNSPISPPPCHDAVGRLGAPNNISLRKLEFVS